MSRLEIKKTELTAEMQQVAEQVESLLGFVPNSLLLLNFNPALAKTAASLSAIVMANNPNGISLELKNLVALMVSSAAGCEYCKKHTSHSARKGGVDSNKIEKIWDYESCSLFSNAEKAALTVAKGSAFAPNAVTDKEFDELKKYYARDHILEIVSVLSLFGFLNRWNSILLTDIEKGL